MRGKVYLLILSLLGISASVYGQDWIEGMYDPQMNYFEVNESYQQYWQTHEKVKGSGHKQFERWRYFIDPYIQKDGSIRPYKEIQQSIESYYQSHPSRSVQGNWVEIGPWTAQRVSRGVGRMNCIGFHPTNPNKIYVGSPSGGIWISDDGGHTWRNPDESLQNFGVTSIAFHPTNPDIMLIGTGDAPANESYGVGVWRSEDGGETWNESNLGIWDKTVSKVMFNPDSVDEVLAATKTGLYQSMDGGKSWQQRISNYDFRDIEFKPGDPKVAYSATWSYNTTTSWVFVSKDGGRNWKRRIITEGFIPDYRYELAVTPANPELLYCAGGLRMMISENSGDTFRTVTQEGGFLLSNDNQAWYNASLDADPNNPNVIYCGNRYLYKSYDGGESWIRLNHTHADNHFISFSPHDGSLWVLDDGGIHRSTDGGLTFTDLTDLGISAIYSVAQSPFNADHALNGYQDCGSKYYDGRTWTSVYGADGMQALFDPTDSNRFYTSYQYGRIVRHLNHIGSNQVMPQPDDEGPWVTPYILDVNDPETMYMGRQKIWKSTNIFESKTKNIKWDTISTGIAQYPLGTFIKIKQHRTNSKRMYALKRAENRSRTQLIACDNIYDSIPVWYNLGLNYPLVTLSSDFETDNRDSSTIYMLADNEVWITTDMGQNWTDFSGTLPDVPMHCLTLDTVTGGLYVGCDAGVFYRGAGQSDWVSFRDGLSRNARVRDMDLYYHPTDHNQSRLKAATYGRGMWESELYGNTGFDPSPVYPVVFSEAKTYTYDQTFDLRIEFKHHIHTEKVNGFDQSDIQVRNGRITQFTDQGDYFEITVEATQSGHVYVDIPQGVATDLAHGLPNDSLTTWRIDYLDDHPEIGPYGPGGVGDSSHLLLWLKADHGLLDANGQAISTDMTRIDQWQDFSGKGYVAVQATDSSRPFFRVDTAGINGHPAVEYNPPNRYFMVNDFGPVGKNLSVFAVAQSNTENWEGHSWIANSRMNNGFLMHNSNNRKSIYAVTVDENKKYLGSPSVEVKDVTEPHVFGLTYNERMWKNAIHLDNQVGYDELYGDHFRDGTDTINIRLGKDYDERYGNGKLGEFIYYSEDLQDARRLIVSNYLAAKFGVDLQESNRYDYGEKYGERVAGIGRVSAEDWHQDAKGLSAFRVSDPDDMENGEFLLWGSDTASVDTWIAGQLPDGMERLARTWRVDETGGDLGQVLIRLNKDDVPTGKAKLGLLYSSTEDFSSNLSLVEWNVGGDGNWELHTNLMNEGYYALVTAEKFFLGEESLAVNMKYQLVPNPAINGLSELRIESFGQDELEIQITDKLGRQLQRQKLTIGEGLYQLPIDLSGEASGIYLITVYSNTGTETYKLVR
ncbi:T9SS type A sorting domain-containing protein [bacterium SCSIO 12741]|nr:T9SS type A sorting domain-containing protein [bacterium SCSIO 12741]